MRMSTWRFLLTLAFASLFSNPALGAQRVVSSQPVEESAQPATLGPYFEQNLGQAGADVHFRIVGSVPADVGERGILFEVADATPGREAAGLMPPHRSAVPDRGATKSSPLHMAFPGAFLGNHVAGERLKSFSSYFLGDDPERWLRNVPHYASVRYRGAYPGVDLEFHGRNGRLEYDFFLAPGADPERIALRFSGHTGIALGAEGSLLVSVGTSQLQQAAPIAFQSVGDRTESVAVSFVLLDHETATLKVGRYDKTRPLVIDPSIVWNVGVPFSAGHVVADAALSTYAVGFDGNARIRKLDRNGQLVWDTTIGGVRTETAIGAAIAPDGSVYVVGQTNSPDFPNHTPGVWTAGVRPGSFIGGVYSVKAFLAKLDPTTGVLLVVTHFGGSTGTGGKTADWANAVAVDGSGHVYVTGGTYSYDFPTTDGAPIPSRTYIYSQAGFLIKLDPILAHLELGTYLSTTLADDQGDESCGFDVAADATGHAVVVGFTNSDTFLTTPGAFDTTNARFDYSGFVTKFEPTGVLAYSTYLGGTFTDEAYAVLIDHSGRACVTGRTGSTDFPRTPPIFPTLNGPSDAFLSCLSADGASPTFSRYQGGAYDDHGYDVGTDALGGLYVMGETRPTSSYQTDQVVTSFASDGTFNWSYTLNYPGSTDNVARGAVGSLGEIFTFGRLNNASQVVLISACDMGLDSACTANEVTITSATRWKPQRSDAPITVNFTGPADLDLTQPANLFVTLQGGLPLPPVALPVQPGIAPCQPPASCEYYVVWNGPWTLPDATRLPAADYALVLRATAGTAPNQRQVGSQYYEKVSLVEVADVLLYKRPGAHDLDANPTAHGGGVRMFAEALVPSDVNPARQVFDKVDVWALARPAVPDPGPQGPVTVYFRSFDVDDPAPSGPIDLDGDATPGSVADNRLEPHRSGLLTDANGQEVAGTVGVAIPANGAGTATTTLHTSRFPGDNYVVVASTSEAWPTQLRAIQPSTTGEVRYASGAALSAADRDQLSELVAVWRTLHVALEKMAPPPGVSQSSIELQGTLTTAVDRDFTDLTDNSISFLSYQTPDGVLDHPNDNDWKGARIGQNSGAPQANVTGNNTHHVSWDSPITFTEPSYVLADDDFSNLADTVWDTSILEDVLRPLYIEVLPEAGLPPCNDRPEQGPCRQFFRNLCPAAPHSWPIGHMNDAEYWYVPVVLAFDASLGPVPSQTSCPGYSCNDQDPTDNSFTHEAAMSGTTPSNMERPSAVVFSETIRDFHATNSSGCRPTIPLEEYLAGTLAHEVAHTLTINHGGDPASGLLMCPNSKIDANIAYDIRTQISAEQRATLRGLVKPQTVTMPRAGLCPARPGCGAGIRLAPSMVPASGALGMEIATPKAKYLPGEPLRVDVSWRAGGDISLWLERGDFCSGSTHLIVENRGQKRVYEERPLEMCEGTGFAPVPLQAGDVLRSTLIFLGNGSYSGVPSGSPLLEAPGEYRLQLAYGKGAAVVLSNVVAVGVESPGPQDADVARQIAGDPRWFYYDAAPSSLSRYPDSPYLEWTRLLLSNAEAETWRYFGEGAERDDALRKIVADLLERQWRQFEDGALRTAFLQAWTPELSDLRAVAAHRLWQRYPEIARSVTGLVSPPTE